MLPWITSEDFEAIRLSIESWPPYLIRNLIEYSEKQQHYETLTNRPVANGPYDFIVFFLFRLIIIIRHNCDLMVIWRRQRLVDGLRKNHHNYINTFRPQSWNSTVSAFFFDFYSRSGTSPSNCKISFVKQFPGTACTRCI